jgi:transcriptional regulator with XRE-family HTH domain
LHKFSERLQECRRSLSLTQQYVAIFLGITERSFQRYEAGEREPNISGLIRLANLFDVSLDYLCGRTDDIEKRGEIIYPLFTIRLKELREHQGFDIFEFARICDIDPVDYAKYEIGKTMPDISRVAAFADQFDVSLDYMIGRSDDPEMH